MKVFVVVLIVLGVFFGCTSRDTRGKVDIVFRLDTLNESKLLVIELRNNTPNNYILPDLFTWEKDSQLFLGIGTNQPFTVDQIAVAPCVYVGQKPSRRSERPVFVRLKQFEDVFEEENNFMGAYDFVENDSLPLNGFY